MCLHVEAAFHLRAQFAKGIIGCCRKELPGNLFFVECYLDVMSAVLHQLQQFPQVLLSGCAFDAHHYWITSTQDSHNCCEVRERNAIGPVDSGFGGRVLVVRIGSGGWDFTCSTS